MTAADAIISIKPEFAEAILDRRKTVELRRRIPNTAVGTTLWIYATMPVGSVLGRATVIEIARATPRAIWNTYKEHVGLPKQTFFDYFEGTTEAVALILGTPERRTPVEIDQLRKMRAGFHPPQVLSRLSAIDVQRLERLSSLKLSRQKGPVPTPHSAISLSQ